MSVLHVDAETDAKALLGTYVCGDTPGDFRWQPGPLAQALAAGRWVLLEDLDHAPPDVLASLAPLLEGRPLSVAGRGESLLAAPGFRLFGSITLRGGAGARRELAGAGAWTRLALRSPSRPEVLHIARELFPHACHLAPPMLASLAEAQRMLRQYAGDDVAPQSLGSAGGRELSLRDVVKWGRRLQTLHAARLRERGEDGGATAALRELAMLEGADILCGSLAPGQQRDSLLRALSLAWAVPPERGAWYDTLHKPSVAPAAGGAHLGVGRVLLPLARGAAASPTAAFALTCHASRLLERLAACVACAEPALLVGETGGGKTAAVAALARACGARLLVVNMSTQSDAADLLGGYKPRDAAAICLPLARRFLELFGTTFPKDANAEFAARVVRSRDPATPLVPRWICLDTRKRVCDAGGAPTAAGRFCRGAQPWAALLDWRRLPRGGLSSLCRTVSHPPPSPSLLSAETGRACSKRSPWPPSASPSWPRPRATPRSPPSAAARFPPTCWRPGGFCELPPTPQTASWAAPPPCRRSRSRPCSPLWRARWCLHCERAPGCCWTRLTWRLRRRWSASPRSWRCACPSLSCAAHRGCGRHLRHV